jgi:hypothetical protein
VGGSLAADIASVYLDLKDCLAMSGSAKNPESESVWEWRNGFYSHWGRHAIDALRVTHVLVWQRVS